MEYLFIIILQFLGVAYHVMQKIVSLGDKYPEKNRSQVFSAFLFEDWDTLIVSLLILFTDLIAHVIMNYYYPAVKESIVTIPLVGWEVPFMILALLMAFILGYAGQRIAYKFLGSAVDFLEKKLDNKPEK